MQSIYLKKYYFLGALIVMAFMLAGCGKEKSLVTSVEIDKNGAVTNTIIEEFDQSLYNLDELSELASSEVSAYNSECLSERIAVESVEMLKDEKTVKMVLKFNSTNDYASFNDTALYFGTVQDAIDRGYEISTELINPEGQVLSSEGLSDYLSRSIIITEDRSVFITPYKIEYYTNGVKLNGKKEAITSDATSEVIQLLLSK